MILTRMQALASNFKALVVDSFAADVRAWKATGWPMGDRFVDALKLTLTSNGLRATLLYRLGRWATVSQVPVIPSILQQLNTALHGIEIYSAVDIGPGLYMPHTVGSVVFAKRIGSGVTLQGGITIGLRDSREYPVIENGVFLAAGCRILGPVRIGQGATIGANAVVLDDVPPGATAVGVPARILESRRALAEEPV